ncbi:hypothetical protein OEW28_07165 [Defluviimonas sp. WL0002]|uniref:DUF8173 domain-containing protein n=1 Tax=Albidovulum marisflavi TaxID=2984159 RepID=A0ABT2ZBH4_9RHOB|nr:hypothetical protein [Defluviimonas sp. WL0002]MCV2868405.1 hypothetical protein [Defluviimonas sp. WL0002]
MRFGILITTLLATCVAASQALAGPETEALGGDLYIGGSGTARSIEADRDVFAGGASLRLDGTVAQDLHATGFDLEIETRTEGDLYAAGGAITIRAETGGDLSAVGFSVRTAPTATTGGNARLAGGTMTIEGPVSGALVASGAEIILDAPIEGDVWLAARTITFGEAARIGGRLTYSAPDEIDIPDTVLPADRITYSRLEGLRVLETARDAWRDHGYPMVPAFLSVFAGFVVMIAFLIGLAAVCLSAFPRQVDRLRQLADGRPALTLLAGIAGLSMLFGLAPVGALTVVGIPLVPVVMLAIVVVGTLGYALGVHILAMRLGPLFRVDPEEGLWHKLGLFAATLLIACLLNLVPVIGWLINYALVLLGAGALTRALFGGPLGGAGATTVLGGARRGA